MDVHDLLKFRNELTTFFDSDKNWQANNMEILDEIILNIYNLK